MSYQNYIIPSTISENGYLNLITPISWLGPSTNIQMGNDILHNIFLKYDVLYLNLNECKKYIQILLFLLNRLINKKNSGDLTFINIFIRC